MTSDSTMLHLLVKKQGHKLTNFELTRLVYRYKTRIVKMCSACVAEEKLQALRPYRPKFKSKQKKVQHTQIVYIYKL